MLRHHVATFSKSGTTFSADCAGGDEAESLLSWFEWLPHAIELELKNESAWKQSADDVRRLAELPLLERLRDRGDAMKIVPQFALRIMEEAAKVIEGYEARDRQQGELARRFLDQGTRDIQGLGDR